MILITSPSIAAIFIMLQLTTQGQEDNPIHLDDEQAGQKFKNMIEEARNRAIIQEAEFTNEPIQLCFAVAKTCIEGDFSVKKREMTKVVQRYFQDRLSIKISHEHFYPRPEPDYSDPQARPIRNQLVIFGVDFLTTNAIKDRLKAIQTQIQQIVWINDSTVKVVCHSQEQTDRILKNQVRQIKLQEEEQRMKEWYLLKSYTIFTFQRPLYARYVTSAEDLSKQITSKYLLFVEAKAGLASFVLQHFNAEEKYKELVEQIQAQRFTKRKWPRRENSHSRSRDKKYDGARGQKEYIQAENQKSQRVSIFKRNHNSCNRRQLRESIVTKYAHRPAESQDYNYNLYNAQHRSEQGNHSYQFSINKIHNQAFDKNTDFHIQATDYSNIDNNLEHQSESFNDFGTFRLTNQPNDNDNRLDYKIYPDSKNLMKQKNTNQDFSFILNLSNNKKQQEQGNSFQRKELLVDRENQNSDFFDFKTSNVKPVQSTLNSSFRIETLQNKERKKVNCSFFEDDSY